MLNFGFALIAHPHRLPDRFAAGDAKDSRKIAVQIDDQFAAAFVWREHDLFDHRADQLGRLATPILFIVRRDHPLNGIVEAARHVRMDENRRFVLRSGCQLQCAFMRLEVIDLVLHERGIDALLEGVQKPTDLALRSFDLNSNVVLRGALLSAQPIYGVGVLAAKHFAGFRLHEPRTQPAKDNALELVLADRQAVLANALIPSP